MKLSFVITAAATIASSRHTLAASSPVLDLSKDLEEAPNLNESPGALAVVAAARSHPAIRTAMVVEEGKIVASYVRDGVDPDEPYQLNSVTKSIAASLIMGILLHEGALSSVNETLGEIFTDESVWEGVPDVEFRKAATIEEMLTMTSGLVLDGYGLYDLFYGDFSEDDCKNGLKAWLTSPSIGTKGKFDYLMLSDILSYVIVERTGMSPREFLNKKVLSYLGIQDSEIDWKQYWECPDGSADHPEPMFGGLHLTATHMAKFGLLYLARGAAGKDARVVPAEYIEKSLTEHVVIGNYMSGYDDPIFEPYNGIGYGYLWYKDLVKFDGFETWNADGAGGQFIFVNDKLGRVSVQQRDEDEEEDIAVNPEYPAFVGIDPSLSFEIIESKVAAGGNVTGGIAAGNVSNDTAVGNVSDDAAAGNVDEDAAAGSAGDNAAAGNVTGDAAAGNAGDDAAAGNVGEDAAAGSAGDNAAAGFGLHSPGLIRGLSFLFCLFAPILV